MAFYRDNTTRVHLPIQLRQGPDQLLSLSILYLALPPARLANTVHQIVAVS